MPRARNSSAPMRADRSLPHIGCAGGGRARRRHRGRAGLSRLNFRLRMPMTSHCDVSRISGPGGTDMAAKRAPDARPSRRASRFEAGRVSSSAFDPFDGVVGGSAEAAGAAEIVYASKGYRTAFDSAPIGIAFVSPEGRWLRVNRALCQLVGYSEEQLLELNISSLTHPDDVEATLERERRQVAGHARRRPNREAVCTCGRYDGLGRGHEHAGAGFRGSRALLRCADREHQRPCPRAGGPGRGGGALPSRRRAGADPFRGARLAHRSAQPSPVPPRARARAQASPPVPRPSRDPLHRHRPLQACQRHARPQGRRRRPPVDREEARPPSARHGHHRPSRR